MTLQRNLSRLACVAQLSMFACAPESAEPSDIAAEPSDIAAEPSDIGAEPSPPPNGTITLDACLDEAGVAERCALVTNASACTASKCSRLVVIFSGGEMGCLTGEGYSNVLAGYAARGYAAVCINYFETPEGSGARPYLDEASRLDISVREATSGPWAQAYWTGDDLLFEGISHGATAPVILMARTPLEEARHWQGRRLTAGCFFDGSYDQAATAALLATGAIDDTPCTVPVPYTRVLERYCGADTSTCDLASHPEALEDTITAVSPSSLAIADFKLFECGSALRPCLGDIIPAAPISTLCSLIDASADHTCSFESLPDDSHLSCHADHYEACASWFETLSPD